MTERKTIDVRLTVITSFILLAALSIVIPHPANFTPIVAIALFGAAYFNQPYLAFCIPVAAMWLGDLVLNNDLHAHYYSRFVWLSPGFYRTYVSFLLITLSGIVLLQKIKIRTIVPACLFSSLLFFIVSNSGVWCSSGLYSPDINGLRACYIAGLSSLGNIITGDLFYCGVLFGFFELAQYRFPVSSAS